MTVDFKYYLNRQGVPGRQGEKGEQGFSPIVTIQEDTLSSYVLAIQTEGNYIVTPNLREHKEDLGGTYIRYNRETGVMYAGEATNADELTFGVVRFATDADIARNDDTTAVTPNNVNSIISDKGLISAEDLQTYLRPGSNITFTINDGVITINGEAGGNYTEGTGIDITGRVISVDFSAVATAAQGAKADSAVQPAALNNYYTKSDTNGLLAEKQNVLSPNPPLAITEYVASNLHGYTYTSNGEGIYLTNSYGTIARSISNNIMEIGREVGTNQDSQVWGDDTGYIDIPFALGQTVSTGKTLGNLVGTNAYAIFGKFVNGEFVPIFTWENGGASGGVSGITTSDTYTTRTGSDYVLRQYACDTSYVNNVQNIDSSQINFTNTQYGILVKIEEVGIGIDITYYNYSNPSYTHGINKVSVTDATLVSRLKEITVCRIVSGLGVQSSHSIAVSSIGLYNYTPGITLSTYYTANSLGDNLFDITGQTAHTYLDLNIGSGLAVQNGNLVNTNPTAPDLSSYYTKSETNDLLAGKADTSDIPTVGNGTITFTQGGVTKGTITTNQSGDATIALDAGGSSYTEGTGIDITNGAISVEASLLQQIATMQDLINQYSYRISALENSINGGNSDFSGNAIPTPSSVSLSSMSPNLFGAFDTQDIDLVQNDLLEENNIENIDNNNNNNNDEEA